MRFILLIGSALLLCGCGKEPPPPAERAAPAADPRPVIVAFGDSLTAGQGVDPGQSYPDFLQREFDRLGYRYRIVNQGVSGDTTTDGLARVSFAMRERPSIVILEFGANDGLRGLPVSTARANLEQLVAALRQGGAQVVLAGMRLPPNYGPRYTADFEKVFRDVARKFDIPLIPFLLEGVGGTTAFMLPDGLHPNVEGNRRVAATVLKTLEPLLRK